MLRVGLTGGIGAGKSTVAGMLAERGSALVDADEIAREIVVPGAPAYGAVVEHFGPAVLDSDGSLDRAGLASIVFSDPDALAALNAITHPAIGALMLERLEALDDPAGSDHPAGARDRAGFSRHAGIAIAVIPLLRRSHMEALRLAAVVVVDCPTEVAIDRLVQARGMVEADVRARIAAQPSREQRLELADYVVDNSSTPEHLDAEVNALWTRITGLCPPDGAT